MEEQAYDYYIIFSPSNRSVAEIIVSSLENYGCSAMLSLKNPRNGLEAEDMFSMIRYATNTIVVLSNNAMEQPWNSELMERAIKKSLNYDKKIIAIIDKQTTIREPFESLLKTAVTIESSFSDDLTIKEAIENIIKEYEFSRRRGLLYEQLNGFVQVGDVPKIVHTIKELIKLLLIMQDKREGMGALSFEIVFLLKQLKTALYCSEWCLDYDDPGHSAAQEIVQINEMIKSPFLMLQSFLDGRAYSLNAIAVCLSIYSYSLDIMSVAVDILTNGESVYEMDRDARCESNSLRLQYIENANGCHGSGLEKEIIEDVPFLTLYVPDWKIELPQKKRRRQNSYYPILKKIADHISESNQLFEQIDDERVSRDFMLCLKTSYKRLKSYSTIVGCDSIASECVEKIALVNQRLRKMETAGALQPINNQERRDQQEDGSHESGIKALLGFGSKTKDHYDVFLSYNHEDSDLAQNVYEYIRDNMLNAFYDKISLPEIGESEYADAIMKALGNSDNFIVIFSNLKQLESHWVQLEMKTFMQEKNDGRKKNANFLMLVTPDVLEEIKETNKNCFDIRFRSCEIITTKDYRERLAPYLRRRL